MGCWRGLPKTKGKEAIDTNQVGDVTPMQRSIGNVELLGRTRSRFPNGETDADILRSKCVTV